MGLSEMDDKGFVGESGCAKGCGKPSGKQMCRPRAHDDDPYGWTKCEECGAMVHVQDATNYYLVSMHKALKALEK